MAKQGTILVVDDNKGILTAVQMLLGTCFEKVITISTPNKIKNTLHDENVDVVLLDMNFSAGINSGNEGLFWLSEIKKAYPSIQVVLFTAYADIDLAVRGIKEGATDFVVKPWDNAKLQGSGRSRWPQWVSANLSIRSSDLFRWFKTADFTPLNYWKPCKPLTKSARPIIKAVSATSSWYPRKAVCSGETATPCSNYGC